MQADETSGHRRPNLTAVGGLAEVGEVLFRRLPVYRECADWVVDTEGRTPDEVAGAIVERFRQAAVGNQP
jgi:shikimate kinase